MTEILGPLNLLVTDSESDRMTKAIPNKSIPCMVCDQTFQFPSGKDELLGHLFMEHRIVISDVNDIAMLDEYILYWSKKINEKNIAEFCTTLLMDKKPDGTYSKNENYYLLAEVLPEDYEIRFTLYTRRLEMILERHKFERTDENFKRDCLYCRDVIEPSTRYNYLEHLYNKHFLYIGRPTNLIYIDQLIYLIEEKMKKLICIFCEKTFKDRTTLKEHMRKKGHKKINPENKNYDKYFLVNYKNFKLNYGSLKNSKPLDLQSKQKQRKPDLGENDRSASVDRVFKNKKSDDDSDSDWSDWEEDKQLIQCLICSKKTSDFQEICEHMLTVHKFDFATLIKQRNFYQKIKIVNYIRRQIHLNACIGCDLKFCDAVELNIHFDKNLTHLNSIDKSRWNQPEFFFPTYEDDILLCYLEDNIEDDENLLLGDSGSEDSGVVVYSEDTNVLPNLEAEKLSLENFKLIE